MVLTSLKRQRAKNCKNISRKPITRLADDESIWNWIISQRMDFVSFYCASFIWWTFCFASSQLNHSTELNKGPQRKFPFFISDESLYDICAIIILQFGKKMFLKTSFSFCYSVDADAFMHAPYVLTVEQLHLMRLRFYGFSYFLF